MKFLTPLGLIGLVGILILILIYIIKPNFQHKFISSTYIWKLSLKYKKKRIPINKLRNLLLIICQVLILTLCATVLAKPAKIIKAKVKESETVIVLDSSASMRTVDELGDSRFCRALDQAEIYIDNVFAEEGIVSIIVADTKPHYLFRRCNVKNRDEILLRLDDMRVDSLACSFGVADIDKAIELTEEVLDINPYANIVLLTDHNYLSVPTDTTVVNVAELSEWNAGILNVYTQIVDNYYVFFVEVACYGRDEEVDVSLEIEGPNKADDSAEDVEPIFMNTTITLSGEKTETLVFKRYIGDEEDDIYPDDYIIVEDDDGNKGFSDSKKWVYSYRSVHARIDVNDSYSLDDEYYIYGGQKEVIKIQYASQATNPFMTSSLLVLTKTYQNRWDIQVDYVKNKEPLLEGYDLYIFEDHDRVEDATIMPEVMPTDGVVLLLNPKRDIKGSGFNVTNNVYSAETMQYLIVNPEGENDPLSKYISVEDVGVSRYRKIVNFTDYTVLWEMSNGDPMLLYQKNEDKQIIVMTFGVNYSNLGIDNSILPKFMYNLFEVFFPATSDKTSYEIGEKVIVNSRGEMLTIEHASNLMDEIEIMEFPHEVILPYFGRYILKQQTYFGDYIENYEIYVSTPSIESNITQELDKIDAPYREVAEENFFDDLLVYVAGALVAILFLEWFLHSKDGNA